MLHFSIEAVAAGDVWESPDTVTIDRAEYKEFLQWKTNQ